MLEGLFSQLTNSTPSMITAVPPVPPPKTPREPLQPTNGGAVPRVPPVPPQKTKTDTKSINSGLSAADRQRLIDYMAAIGETDQATIDALLTQYACDADALAWVLSWANQLLPSSGRPKAQSVSCRSCLYFKSYNAHGGGAGQCGIGARSAGHCQWSDDVHQCGKFSKDGAA